jgi:hypothetical protein
VREIYFFSSALSNVIFMRNVRRHCVAAEQPMFLSKNQQYYNKVI